MLRAIGRDLRRRYGERFRVVAVGSGQEALGALAEVALRGPGRAPPRQQGMPQMDGITFLGRRWPTGPMSGAGQGTGLVLDIAHRIVTQHQHGAMTVRSHPGDTRFEVVPPGGGRGLGGAPGTHADERAE